MALDKDLAKQLAAANKLWTNAQPQQGFVRPPDGDYIAKIIKMEIGNSQSTNRIQLVTTFELLNGEAKGDQVLRFDGLVTEQNMSFTKGFLEVIGCPCPEKLSDLPGEIEQFMATNQDLFDIQLKTKGEYQNTYVKQVSQYTEEEIAASEQEPTGEEADQVLGEGEEEQTEEETPEEYEEEQQPEQPKKKAQAPVARSAQRPAAQPVKKSLPAGGKKPLQRR